MCHTCYHGCANKTKKTLSEPYIFPTPPCISPASPIHLPYIAPTSPLHLAQPQLERANKTLAKQLAAQGGDGGSAPEGLLAAARRAAEITKTLSGGDELGG